jgi:hypothetical protein
VEAGDPRKVRFDVISVGGQQKLVVMLNTMRGILVAAYESEANSWALLGKELLGGDTYTEISSFLTLSVRSVAVGNDSKCCLFIRHHDHGFECQEYQIQPLLREDLSDCAVVEREPTLSTIALMASGVLAQTDELALSLRPTPAPGVTDLFRQAGERVMGVFGLRSSRP